MEVAPLIFLECNKTCEKAFGEIPVVRTKKVTYTISNKKFIEKKPNNIAVLDPATGSYYLLHCIEEITDRMWNEDKTKIALNEKLDLKPGFLYRANRLKRDGFDEVRNEDCKIFSYRMTKWVDFHSEGVLIACVEDYDKTNTKIINKQFLVELERIEMN